MGRIDLPEERQPDPGALDPRPLDRGVVAGERQELAASSVRGLVADQQISAAHEQRNAKLPFRNAVLAGNR